MESFAQESTLITRLKQMVIYQQLEKKCSISPEFSDNLALINDVGNYAINKSKTIIKNMPEFTLHDQEHLFNMLYIAGKLIPKNTLCKLSIPDLMFIILSIFLHDIGMSPEENIVKAWKGQLSDSLVIHYADESKKFQRFRQTYLHMINDIEALHDKGEHAKAQLLEDKIITDYIRINHADRARKMIATDWEGRITYQTTDLTPELAEICFSHNENALSLLNMESIKLFDESTFLCMPFVSVILRLADIIDFDPKRTPAILFSHLAIEHPVSLAEWKKHQAITSWVISNDGIIYSAQCSHPAIEASIMQFCDLIDEELRNCTLVLANLKCDLPIDIARYKIPLPPKVERQKIQAKRDIATGRPIYRYHETKFTLSKAQVIDLLMGTKLYGKPEVALRELIQNSIDACLLRHKLCEVWGEIYVPKITVSLHTLEGKDYLRVTDNGIGMNQHIIDNYYTNIGKSFYTSSEFYEMMSATKEVFKPISKFGIGILSCFMVCDNLTVDTRRMIGQYKYDEPLRITIEGIDSLFVITDSDKNEPGTDTTLLLRETHPWKQFDKNDFIAFVKKIIPLPPFDICIETDDDTSTCSPETFEDYDFSLEADYSWKEEENIKIVDLNLDCEEMGLQGKASIAYIAKRNGEPVAKIKLLSKEVFIDDDSYTLSADISYSFDGIKKNTSNLEVNEDGRIEQNSSYRDIAHSKSLLSIYGIDVPCNLFWSYLNRDNKCMLRFPFPMRFRLNIGDEYNLSLNTARTQIVYDNEWLRFERDLLKLTCVKIKESLSSCRWKALQKIFIANTVDEDLRKIIASI